MKQEAGTTKPYNRSTSYSYTNHEKSNTMKLNLVSTVNTQRIAATGLFEIGSRRYSHTIAYDYLYVVNTNQY